MKRFSLLFMGVSSMLQAQGSDFKPCPARPEPCAIMPLGSSTTYGVGSSDLGGYRKFLLEKAWAQGKTITFVGDMLSGPETLAGRPFPRANEGHSGYVIQNIPGRAGILELVETTLRKNKPHIVLLLVGTNDVIMNYELSEAPGRLGRLLDRITETSPDALVVLGKLALTRNDEHNQRIRILNASMQQLVSDRKANGKHIALVDMEEAFPARSANWKSDFLSDELHPNDAGFAVQSGVWYEAIGHLLE